MDKGSYHLLAAARARCHGHHWAHAHAHARRHVHHGHAGRHGHVHHGCTAPHNKALSNDVFSSEAFTWARGSEGDSQPQVLQYCAQIVLNLNVLKIKRLQISHAATEASGRSKTGSQDLAGWPDPRCVSPSEIRNRSIDSRILLIGSPMPNLWASSWLRHQPLRLSERATSKVFHAVFPIEWNFHLKEAFRRKHEE